MILQTLLAPRREQRSNLTAPSQWFLDAVGASKTASGENVTEKGALALDTYFACIRVISEDVAKLPLSVYRHLKPRGREMLTGHPVHKLIHTSPKPNMTSMTFRQTMTHHALGWGNGYAEIMRRGDSTPLALELLDPTTIKPKLTEAKTLMYEQVVNAQTKEVRRIQPRNMLHIHGMGFDGLQGYSVARIGRESMGKALALQKFAAAFFGNGAWLGGVLEHPGKLTKDARDHLRASWTDRHVGADKALKTGILEEGMTFKQLGVNPEDAQAIQAEQHSVETICRWFRVAPHKVQHLLRATFSNIEHQAIEHVGDTIMPWGERWEQEIKLKMLPGDDDLFAKHTYQKLMQTDHKARSEFYNKMFMIGAFGINDILELEDRNPIGPEGDVHYVPLNMVPADKAMEGPAPAPAPANDSQPPADDSARRKAMIDQIVEAHRPSFVDAYRRILRVETDKAKRAAKRDDTEWAEKFYAGHAEVVRGALIPPVNSLCDSIWAVLVGGDQPERVSEEIARLTAEIASFHVDRSLDEISKSPDAWQGWSDSRAEDAAQRALVTLIEFLICHVGDTNDASNN